MSEAMECTHHRFEIVLRGKLRKAGVGLHHPSGLAANVDAHCDLAQNTDKMIDYGQAIFCAARDKS
jgi:hypothetical protein